MTSKQEWLAKYPKQEDRRERFSTLSDMDIEPLYSPEDLDSNYEREIGVPGEYPFTRGVYPSMYRSKRVCPGRRNRIGVGV